MPKNWIYKLNRINSRNLLLKDAVLPVQYTTQAFLPESPCPEQIQNTKAYYKLTISSSTT